MTRKRNTRAMHTTRFALRYNSKKDYGLVRRAATLENMSLNTWLMRVSLAAAKRRIAKAEAPAPARIADGNAEAA